ncbi:hypothetical protein [uncultured Maribacter sp.]|uniref:hypothetical protein n=1 Tax=uncultured Maribacter sp. TaxID=431308 RepID=UPI0030DDCC83
MTYIPTVNQTLTDMSKRDNFFDSKMVVNLMLVLTLMLSAIYYLNYSEEIQDEVTTVIVNSLNDANNSLAEQESDRK